MSDLVVIPWWALLVLSIAAAIAIYDRIFAPSVRWFFRRRINSAIDELNNRLEMRIQPFKLTRRQSLVDQLMYDAKVIEGVENEAKRSGEPRAVVMSRAQKYAREIVPHFSAFAYFGFGTKAARWLSQLIYRVRLGYSDDEALKSIPKDASVVFVMNHRSNMDYVLVTYMASARASLSYAVGEWARIWLLQSIIRAMGAYFIRRDSGDELYRLVLARYVRMATREGVTQAVFPEGGLSRDGKLREPRLGLISYMVNDFDPKKDRDIVFIPVGINYDRVIEDRILTSKLEKEATGRKFRVRLGTIAKVFWQLLVLRVKGQLYRAGYAVASFGKPISLAQYAKSNKQNFAAANKTKRFATVEKLGKYLINEIGNVIPATPVALVAHVLMEADGEKIGELELKARVHKLIALLEDKGAHSHIPRKDRDYAVSTGLRMLSLRHAALEDENGHYFANPDERILLKYYANSISQLVER